MSGELIEEGLVESPGRRRRDGERNAPREDEALTDPPAATDGDDGPRGRPGTEKKASGDDRAALRGVSGAASEIVHRAAAILGDEIAAGIVAAKQVEGRFLKRSEVKDQAPQELMQRFRKDAHEVVDIMMDLLTSITGALGSLVDQANGAGAGSAEAAPPVGGRTESIRVRIAAGETAHRTIKIDGLGGVEEPDPVFVSTDFVAGSGRRLPASCVSFDTGVGATGEVDVVVRVPEGVPISVYSGLVRWGRNGRHRAVMEVLVDRGQ